MPRIPVLSAFLFAVPIAAHAQCVNMGAYQFCQPGYEQQHSDYDAIEAEQQREQALQQQEDQQSRFEQERDYEAASHPRWGEDR